MIHITNKNAAAEASELSYELFETVLRGFAHLPFGGDLSRLLTDEHLQLRKAATRRYQIHHPSETIEVLCEPMDLAGDKHEIALRELTQVKTSDLCEGKSVEQLEQDRDTTRANFITECKRLSRPLRILRLVPGAQERRSKQWAALQSDAVATLEGTPLSGSRFDEVLESVLTAVSLDREQIPELELLKSQSVALHEEYRERWETILMLAWEAIATNDGGSDADLGPGVRRDRFRSAKAKAVRDKTAEMEANRLRAEEKSRKDLEMRRLEIAREYEERERFNKLFRPSFGSYVEPEPENADNEYEK